MTTTKTKTEAKAMPDRIYVVRDSEDPDILIAYDDIIAIDNGTLVGIYDLTDTTKMRGG